LADFLHATALQTIVAASYRVQLGRPADAADLLDTARIQIQTMEMVLRPPDLADNGLAVVLDRLVRLAERWTGRFVVRWDWSAGGAFIDLAAARLVHRIVVILFCKATSNGERWTISSSARQERVRIGIRIDGIASYSVRQLREQALGDGTARLRRIGGAVEAHYDEQATLTVGISLPAGHDVTLGSSPPPP